MDDHESVLKTVSEGVRNGGFVVDDAANEIAIVKPAASSESTRTVAMADQDQKLLHANAENGQRKLQDASNFGHSGRLAQPGLELRFEHLHFSIKGKQILQDVSGVARPGKVLAVMGPSGSGKTTLLNVLGGRIMCQDCHATIGGQQLNKKTRRKISYVLQQDIFFPNLTLQQTLRFAAELQLPESMSTDVKKEIVQQLIEQLDMQKCTHTIIGNNMNRGLSGGEKKRANIANELLTDPAVLLLDEPTSGLDSSTAYALTLSLKKYAVQSGKTVMMTIHQPSVQMFFKFDDILLLSGGRIAYYGSPENVLKHFGEIGFSCDVTHYNPADFILDIVKSGTDAADRLIAASNRRRQTTPDCPILRKTTDLEKDQCCLSKDDVVITTETDLTNFTTDEQNNKIRSNGHVNCERYSSRDPESADEVTTKPEHNSDLSLDESHDPRWSTSYIHQTKILTIRSFVQGKFRYLSKLKFIKTIGVAIIAGLIWFQVGRGELTEGKVNDIAGSLFFICLINAFDSLFNVLVVFPDEREVVNKERLSGSYRLSAYYISKSFSELPLSLVLPTISIVLFYWTAGLNGFNDVWAFFGTWFVIIGVTLASQSLGLFVSAATMDFDHSLVLAIFMMISFMLLGGYYVKNFPYWLQWLRYVSPFMYAWTLMLYLEFNSDTRVVCNAAGSPYPSCAPLPNGTSNGTRYVPAQEILDFNKANTQAWVCIVAIITAFFLFRILGYFFLRMFHKPITK